MFALGQVHVDVRHVRAIWIIIINMHLPNNTNIQYALHIIDITATFIAELMGESSSLCFLRMTEASHLSILMCFAGESHQSSS